ncbi:SIS domain-containing protein [Curtobacterium sp. MCPF17_002]|uniref:SIS domain-containing protein n=1 Tax=Curtobacterium sp. MCPF17_002 TaxID=2175645 RepID=UPI000DAAB643|nr:SIS domain-containing protein [Curtobacterium sp. MCPF17_002]WIB77939.1 SIS domain-containing protein [Curtobacterium sp. MCPF17_002]
MLGFSEQKLRTGTQDAIDLRPEIEAAVLDVLGRSPKNLYLVGAGGTYAAMLPYEVLMRSRSTFPTTAAIGKELMLLDDPNFGEGSVALFASVSGTTEDVIEAIEYAKSRGVLTVGFTGVADSPFAAALDVPLIAAPKGWPYDVQLLVFTLKFLSERGEFDGYDQFVADLQKLPDALVAAAEQAESTAEAFADEHRDTDYYFLVGGGNLWGLTYLYSMCVLEEMQWLRTTRVHSAEFFHGSLELIERDTAVLVFAGEDSTRPLTDRVIRFAEQYSDDVTVLDSKDYALGGIGQESRAFFAPLVLDVVSDRFSKHLERARDHSLDLRRYYRVVEY